MVRLIFYSVPSFISSWKLFDVPAPPPKNLK